MIRPVSAAVLAIALAAPAVPQSRTLKSGAHRMEITLERLDGERWRVIDPGLVLAQGDRVRFRYRTNFDGYLYVSNLGTGGSYQQLFPREDTGQDNMVRASKDYQVPASSSGAFRVAGPAGHDIVYWMVTPARVADTSRPPSPAAPVTPKPAPNLIPRCDDSILRARGDCVDSSAGPKLIPRGEDVPDTLADAAGRSESELMVMKEGKSSVVASPAPLTGPVIYEFRLAHK
jgi:uncharacterized protein DUF4384